MPAAIDPLNCPNCDSPVASTKTPYCGQSCREFASFVRQFRGALAEGSVLNAERQEALGQVFWFLLGGGRPLRLSFVPDRVRAQVLARDGGLCRLCRSPATTVDHIATGCNRPINLQAVCASCCRARSFGDANVLEAGRTRLDEMVSRIGASVALRCCDDPVDWDWRGYVAIRPRIS